VHSRELHYHMVLSLVSPLLDGPFLISPSRRQSTTPGESHTRTRSSLFFHQGKLSPACAALAPWLPQGRLRGEVPTELKRLRKQKRHSTHPAKIPGLVLYPLLFSLSLSISQPVYPQVGLDIFLLIEYPHTTLSPVAPRRLSTRA
jgi:hypothetical protein